MMPIVYTPVVGEACQKYSHIYRRGRGLYIAYEQRDRIEAILRERRDPEPLGDRGDRRRAHPGPGRPGRGRDGHPDRQALPLHAVRGRLALQHAPITLDVGTDNQERLADPLYLGMRHERVRGAAYQEFIDAFVAAVQKVFPHVVLQWEDFLKENALHSSRASATSLHVQRRHPGHGGAWCSPGSTARCASPARAMRDQRVVFAGAGASAQGISELLVAAFMEDGLTPRGGAPAHLDDRQPRAWSPATGRSLEEFKATYARPRRGGGRLRVQGPLADHAGRDRREREAHHADRRPRRRRASSTRPWSGPWPASTTGRSSSRSRTRPRRPSARRRTRCAGRRGGRSWRPAARSRP